MNEAAIAAVGISRRSALALPLIGALAYPADRILAISGTDAATDLPLGIGLEGWPYPGPVAFLPLKQDGIHLRMAYMDFAPARNANGRSIFLLHGKNFDSSYWSGPISWLREAGYRVVVPDQIGFNKSSKPDMNYSFEGLAHNTIRLADALSLGRISVLGHSTGGALAVQLASMYPDRIEKLVLEDPLGLVDYRQFIPAQETETLVAAEIAYTAETYRAFIAHFFNSLPQAAQEPYVTWRMRVAGSGEFDRFARAAALTYQMIYRQPTRALYAELPMPVLIAAGTEDEATPLINYASPESRSRIPRIHQAAQEAAKEMRQSRFVTFPGVGHVPHLEMPDRFRSSVLDFLS